MVHSLARKYACSVIPEFFANYPDYFLSLTVNSEEGLRRASIDWVLAQYIQKEYAIRSAKGLVICDRSPLDLIVYSLAFGSKIYAETVNAMKRIDWSSGRLFLLLAPKSDELLRRIRTRNHLDSFSSTKILNGLVMPLEKEDKRLYSIIRSTWVSTDCPLPSVVKRIVPTLQEPYMPTDLNKTIKTLRLHCSEDDSIQKSNDIS